MWECATSTGPSASRGTRRSLSLVLCGPSERSHPHSRRTMTTATGARDASLIFLSVSGYKHMDLSLTEKLPCPHSPSGRCPFIQYPAPSPPPPSPPQSPPPEGGPRAAAFSNFVMDEGIRMLRVNVTCKGPERCLGRVAVFSDCWRLSSSTSIDRAALVNYVPLEPLPNIRWGSAFGGVLTDVTQSADIDPSMGDVVRARPLQPHLFLHPSICHSPRRRITTVATFSASRCACAQ